MNFKFGAGRVSIVSIPLVHVANDDMIIRAAAVQCVIHPKLDKAVELQFRIWIRSL